MRVPRDGERVFFEVVAKMATGSGIERHNLCLVLGSRRVKARGAEPEYSAA